MESRKDIGKAFREKLDQLHKQPGDTVWDSIKSDLIKKRRKAVPVWLRFWAITGVFLLLGFFTYPLWENYVPHIYIKMPEQEKEQISNETIEGSNRPANYSTGKPIENGYENNSTVDANNTGTPLNSTLNRAADPAQTDTAQQPSATLLNSQDALVEGNTKNNKNKKQQHNLQNSSAISGTGRKDRSSSQTTNGVVSGRNTVKLREVAENASYNSNNGRATINKKQNYNNSKGSISLKGNNAATNSTNNTENNDHQDEGFIVPMSAAYKSYRNNIARTVVIDSIANDSIEADSGKDFAKVTDSLRKMQSTGVKDVLKVPDTKKESGSDKGFYIYGFAAPTKYTFAENAGYIDAGLQNKNTSSKSSLAYGAYLGYNISGRLSIRLGAIKSKTELKNDNIFVPPADFEGIEYEAGMSNTAITEQLNNSGNDDDPSAIVNIRNNFEFIEVPVELTYRLYNGNKIGLGVLGGFITRFTTDNTVYAENETGSLQIGKIKSLKELNNGFSFGGSFNYTIVPNLQLNIEPVFKYFFNKDSFIKQHTYSLQAGIQFNF
jgi:hypothetical protein